MAELKPCPFCGGKARVVQYIDENPLNNTYTVGCQNGECFGFAHPYSIKAHRRYSMLSRVIEEWNTRAERTCPNCGARVVGD